MTVEEKFVKGNVVFQDSNGNYVLELWGASTKHPDITFNMKDYTMAWWVDKNDPEQVKGQVFQWLLECASNLELPMAAKVLTEYALKEWCIWEGDDKSETD